MIDLADIVLRLGAATVIGGAIGVNRDLHRKSAGLRTLGLVALASAAITLGSIELAKGDGATRVIQGLVTGIGFLGAGVIVRSQGGHKVHGLTTAAAIWSATSIGALSAMGLWPILGVTSLIALALLSFGGQCEKWLHNSLAGDDEPEARQPDDNGSGP